MKITAQEEYGLRCLLRLAQAGGQSATIPEIALAEGLSVPYVAKLLSVLRQVGMIESVRGRSGGYRLARPPAEIGLGSLLLVLGEPLFDEPGYCEKHKGSASVDGQCVHQGSCTLRGLWLTLEQWLRHTLDQITLADLCESEVRVMDLIRLRLGQAVLESPASLLTLTLPRSSAQSRCRVVFQTCLPVLQTGNNSPPGRRPGDVSSRKVR